MKTPTVSPLAATIFDRIAERRSGGLTNGILVFGSDGSGGAYYTAGSRPQLTPNEIAVHFDHRSSLRSVQEYLDTLTAS